MRLLLATAGQGVGVDTSAAADSYLVVKADGTVAAGTGALTAIGISGCRITLSAADTSVSGPIAIIVLDVAANAIGWLNCDVDVSITAAGQFVAALAPAATGYTVVRANGTAAGGTGTCVAVPGAAGAFKSALSAADVAQQGTITVLYTTAGAAVVGQAPHNVVPVPVAPTAFVQYTLTLTSDRGGTPVTIPVTVTSTASLLALIAAVRAAGGWTMTVTQTNTVAGAITAAPIAPAAFARVINDQRGM